MFGVGEPSPAATPISLTPQAGQIESFSFSADGRYLYYGTNATDSERRHLWRVPTRGGTPEQLTKGTGIEHDPLLLPSGKHIAALTADYKRPQSVAIFPAPATGRGARRLGAEGRLSDADQGVPHRRARRAAGHRHQGGRRPRVPQPVVPAEGPARRREASGDRLRPRRPGAADDPRLPLHGGLPPLLRREPVAREPGLRGPVGQLPQRHRLRQVVPHRAEHQPARQLRIPGRARRRQVPADAARRRSRSASASGASRTAAC